MKKSLAAGSLAVVFATLGALLLAPGASGQERSWVARRPPPPPAPAPCRVTVEDATGRALPTYYGGGRTYVLGERGERYAIRVDNRTGGRVEAVLSVDGRDAVSGQIGDYRRQRGYVLGPYGSVTVDGFRQSLDAVATFRFADPGQSYSARRGTPENVGVLGVACFTERPAPIAYRPPPPPYADRDDEAPRSAPARASSGARAERSAGRAKSEARPRGRSAPPGTAPAPEERAGNLGTEYGESRYSPVSTTSFRRADGGSPRQLVTLYYDDLEGLEARGIVVRPWREPDRWAPPPRPFPHSGFAPPPP
jgi:hypothetical protein